MIEKDDSAWAQKEGTVGPMPPSSSGGARDDVSGATVSARPFPRDPDEDFTNTSPASQEPANQSRDEHHKPGLVQKLRGE